MTTWLEIEAAVRERGWKRNGREWHGPCPLTNAGTDRAWVAPSSGAEFFIGCRQHGGGLTGDDFSRHVRALVGDRQSPIPPPPAPAPKPKRQSPESKQSPESNLPGLVWEAAGEATDTPGHRYLAGRCVWPTGGELPATVRWLTASAAADVGLRPRLPKSAAGCLIYRYAAPDEESTHAVQFEAVDASGAAVPVAVDDGRPAKRPGVRGSQLGAGRRTFVARAGKPGGDTWIVEGAIDALAVVVTNIAAPQDEVRAAWAISGFQMTAVEDVRGTVVIAPDADAPRDAGEVGAGQRAGLRLLGELRAAERPCRLELPPSGFDWGDVAVHRLEREAIRQEYDDAEAAAAFAQMTQAEQDAVVEEFLQGRERHERVAAAAGKGAQAAAAEADKAREQARERKARRVSELARLPWPETILRLRGKGGSLLSAGQVGILAGEGGTGKSALIGSLAVGVAAGLDTGPVVAAKRGQVLIVAWEDHEAIIGWRANEYALHAGVNDPDVHVFPMSEPIFGPLEREAGAGLYNSRPGKLPGWESILGAMEDVGPRLVILDPTLCAFAGEQNNGAAVREFLRALSGLAGAQEDPCAVMIVAHSTKEARRRQGPADPFSPGSVAGSSHWTDGCRSALSLRWRPELAGARDLVALKSNHGPARMLCGLETVRHRSKTVIGFEAAADWYQPNAAGGGGDDDAMDTPPARKNVTPAEKAQTAAGQDTGRPAGLPKEIEWE